LRALLVAACFAIAVVFLSPALLHLREVGGGDFAIVHHRWEAARVALAVHHELPLWDPWICGGVPLLGDPEAQHLSPLFPLALVFGSAIAIKVFLVAHVAVALAGAFLLARQRMRASHPAAAMAAVAWACSGFFAAHLSMGHVTFAGLAFAPWVLLALDARAPLRLAGVLALALLSGGALPFVFLLILLALDALAHGGARTAIPASALGALLGAAHLLPSIATLLRHPRPAGLRDGLGLDELGLTLVERDLLDPWLGHPFGAHEYAAYVGVPILVLAAVGAVVRFRKYAREVVLLVLLLLLALGDRGLLFPLLRALPGLGSLRVGSRFLAFATLYLALLAGAGLDVVAKRVRAKRLVYIVAAAIAADVLYVSIAGQGRWTGPPITVSEPRPFRIRAPAEDDGLVFNDPARNTGSLFCYRDAVPWELAPGIVAAPRNARVDDPEGRVLRFARTSRTIEVDVVLTRPSAILINQNFAPGWTGGRVGDGGLLAFDLPAGQHTLVARYRPPFATAGLALSVLGCALTVLFARRAAASRSTTATPGST